VAAWGDGGVGSGVVSGEIGDGVALSPLPEAIEAQVPNRSNKITIARVMLRVKAVCAQWSASVAPGAVSGACQL